ncbi:MAG TPA: D-glycero-D-manno-heptose 1-phosphate guanosyltransferase [Cyanobacteria bacterium UBA11162]|nr:D-glycero-D-manno-heptose 1-phosphate guanosyltransferase [Cyanobacteria bacterium UBA11162]
MDIIILAGGLGTRLRTVVKGLPKPMASVANRPFLEYLFDYLIRQDINNTFIVSVGYEYQKIINHFGDNYKSYHLIYVVEDTPLGTGGGIKLALSQTKTEQVLIINGDTLFNANLPEMINFHFNKDADITLALKPLTNFERYNNIRLDKYYKVMEFQEKQMKEKGYINGGIYILRKKILETFNLPDQFSFEEDFLKPYSNQIKIYGFISSNYFIDIGIPEDYKKSQIQLPLIGTTIF